MKITLHIWRQAHESDEGRFEIYQEDGVNGEMSFLEMLDVLNERLIAEGKEPVAFESDCREGICGACGMVLNGVPHGPKKAIAVCQLHMRSFSDGEEIWLEPWRASAFPIVKDLVVDRSSLDRIIESAGYITVRTGSAPDANAIPVSTL